MELNNNNIKMVYDHISELVCLNLIIFNNLENSLSRINSYKTSEKIEQIEYDVYKLINNAIKIKDSTYVYFVENEMKLRYMGFGIYDNEKYVGVIIAGPYVKSEVDEVSQGNSYFGEIYDVLPIISDKKEKSISYIFKNLISDSLIKVSYLEIDNKKDLLKDVKKVSNNYDMDVVSVKRRYLMENELIHCIVQNNPEKALGIISNKFFQFGNKFSNYKLKDKKIFALDMNTLMRRASVESNVDPYIVHNISEKVIKNIEWSREAKEIDIVINKMVREYCFLISNHVTQGYSILVAKAIKYITLNFTEDISLKDVAKALCVNPSHLARKFKFETGSTVSHWINKSRIRESKLLLKNRLLSIEEIAYRVGYNNKNYFTKIFKQFENKTPKEYKLSDN